MDMPNTSPKQDTTNENGRLSLLAVATDPVSNKIIQIIIDAVNARLKIYQVDNTGAAVSGFGSIVAAISDFFGTNKDAKFRKAVLRVDDGSGGFYNKYSNIFCTDVEGSDLGGSGGGAGLFTIVSMHGDYIVGTPLGGGSNVNIARDVKLRNSITSETIDSVTYSYDYSNSGVYVAALGAANAQYCNRLATWNSGANTEHQDITPRYLSGDVIFAAQVPNTGVTVSGTPVIWQEVTNRAWSQATY
jgi:hypothetical protein